MAKKSLVLLTALGVTAIAVGVYASRRRYDNQVTAIGTAAVSPRSGDWSADDTLTEQLTTVLDEESVAAR